MPSLALIPASVEKLSDQRAESISNNKAVFVGTKIIFININVWQNNIIVLVTIIITLTKIVIIYIIIINIFPSVY